MLPQIPNELQVILRQGAIRTDGQQSCSHLREPVFGGLHVVFEDTPQAWGVHQPKPRIPFQGGKFKVDHLHILLVGRVFGL